MTAEMTATIDPQNKWQHKTYESLRTLCDCHFDFWRHTSELGWMPVELASSHDSKKDFFDENAKLIDKTSFENFLDQILADKEPEILELASPLYVLAIPLRCQSGEVYVATCVQKTEMPQQLLGLGQVGQRFLKQQEEIKRLENENSFFLHQVSEDFESLTFLGFMAERLSLGEEFNSLDEILKQSLMRLGRSIKTQTLCYIEGYGAEQPSVRAIWQDEDQQNHEVDQKVLLEIISQYREDAKIQPVIKNVFEDKGYYPDVKDFILVKVSTSVSDFGWLIAVNRVQPDHNRSTCSAWRLSQQEFGTNEASLLSTAATMLASHANNLHLFQEREALLVNVVRSLVSAVEAKDDYTCGHSERVALFAKRLAKQIGYSNEDCELLYLTGLLHDVGKIAVSDAVLNKTDALTEEEYAEIMQHPDEGWAILRELSQLDYVLPGVLHHHERYDGKGYPDKLVGEDIPLDGRVLAVADAYDAMTSNRAYRKGMPQEKAEEILRDGAGTQWDEEIIEAFFEVVEDLKDMRVNYQPRQHPIRKPNQELQIS